MRAMDTMGGVVAAMVAVLTAGPAMPQMRPAVDAAMHTLHQPYEVETFGVFRSMMMAGDFAAKERLDALMQKQPTLGVGALSEARGEITIYDGKLIVSYGSDTPITYASESAALLATARIDGWQSILIGNDVLPGEVEAFIANAAKTHGIDPGVSFPFEVRGGIGPYVMHVNAAPTNGEHGMDKPMAVTVRSEGDRADSLVAGLYVSPDLMGTATHGGERTHAHWVSLDKTRTAHLDRWGMKAGAFLLLPKPQ
jgi:hypothetical protein